MQQASTSSQPGRTAETGHVLAVELVGLARFTRDEQPGVVTEFQRLVMSTQQVRESLDRNSLLVQQRGHVIYLVFLGDSLAPLKCALQAANEARRRPNVRLRMGIHSGPIQVPSDLTDERDCVGEALSGAALLMTTGREDHILVSEPVARAASTVELWSQYVHDLGDREIRPGTRLRLFSLHGGGIGNPADPASRVEAASPGRSARRRISAWAVLAAVFLMLIVAAAAAWIVSPDARTWAESRYRAMFPAPSKAVAKKKPAAKSKVARADRRTGSKRYGARTTATPPSQALGPVARPRTLPPTLGEPPSSVTRQLSPPATSDSEESDSDGGHFTALILNARGLGIKPGGSIRIVGASGEELWSGTPEYAASTGTARRFDLAGENPLVLKVSQAAQSGDLTLGSDGEQRLRSATSENPFLDSNCVIVVP